MHDTPRNNGSTPHNGTHHAQTAQVDPTASLVEDIFLSPRVIDSATYAEFAESLRHLVAEAGRGRETIRQAMRETDGVVKQLQETAAQAGERLRPAVKLIPTIDQKLRQAEDALARATEAAHVAEQTANEAAKAAAAESLVALREAQAALDAASERASGLEKSLTSTAERAEAAIAALDRECTHRLETASKHAQGVLGTLIAELETRGEEAVARLTAMLEERKVAAEAAMGEAIEIVSDEQDGRSEAIVAKAAEAMDRAEAAAARAEEAEQAAIAAEARLKAAEAQLSLIDERGREIAENANYALGMFDRELSSRMQAVRETMEQLAQLSAERENADVQQAMPAHATEVKPEARVAGTQSPAPQNAVPQSAPAAQPQGPHHQSYVRIDRPVG